MYRALMTQSSSLALPRPSQVESFVGKLSAGLADPEALVNTLSVASPSGLGEFRHDPVKWRYLASAPERPIQRGTPPPTTLAEESVIADALVAVGASTNEYTTIVSTLKAAGGMIGEPDIVESVATKIYVKRRIAGVLVAGDYAAATFTLQGEFVRFVARWRPIDYDSSAIATGLSHSDALDIAASALAEASVPLPSSVFAIEVSTVYRLRDSYDNMVVAELHLVASVRNGNGNGSGMEGKIPSYEFPITTAPGLPQWVAAPIEVAVDEF